MVEPASPMEPRASSPVQVVENDGPLVFQTLLILIAGFWIFSPSLIGDWLWDDALSMSGNPLLNDPARLWKTWFVPGSFTQYYPLTATVQWLQWEFWHNDTLGYHLTNVGLHVLNSLLVWRLLGKFGLRLAWWGGLLFAIHPLAVESVAWISEIKNTLVLPPFLLAACFGMDYAKQGRTRDYFFALGFFLIAMLCKVSVVLFPLVILLHAWWQRGRLDGNDLKVSAPFFIISLVVGGLNLLALARYPHFENSGSPEGLLPRLVAIGLSISFSVSKFFLPVALCPVYPKWTVDPPSLLQFLPWPVLGAVFAVLWRQRWRWGRHALLGVGFFVINLAPCPGFIPPSDMSFAWVMDHFLYLPVIGLIGLVVAGAEHLGSQLSRLERRCGIGFLAILSAWLAWQSHWYAGIFINSTTFWTYTLERNANAWPAYNDLGNTLQNEGRLEEAVEMYRRALQLNPHYLRARNNLGSALQSDGKPEEAIAQYQQVLEQSPHYPEAHYNLGNTLLGLGRTQEAIAAYEEAIEANPNYAEAHNNLGNALMQIGQDLAAQAQYQKAIQLNPDNAAAYNNLGFLQQREGRRKDAIENYRTALRINPHFTPAQNNLDAAQ